MSDFLLSTKFHIPPARIDRVPRPHLILKLQEGVEQPGNFVLISGPAGFGKTTLLSEFASRHRGAVAWLSLDEKDNDPNRFWMYLIAACQNVHGEIGEAASALLRSSQALPGEVLATLMINDLTGLEQDFTLILDDYHTIQNEIIQGALIFLLEHLPVKFHVVISTRIDPPWPLARFRAHNQLVEIRVDDLRFSHGEAASFLGRVMELDLTAQDIAALEERTEGWVAGLQLAALSMKGKGRRDISDFVKTFTGSHIYIAEYLVDEVLKRQAEEVQKFMLQTAILERLNADLCEAVTGCANGQATLLDLYRANLFVVSLDDEGNWYRYHQLFSDLLRSHLQRSMPKETIYALHQRAADWYEQAGMPAEAIEHALAAKDESHVVRLAENFALATILQARLNTVERWLQAIPVDAVEKSPRLNMAYAWMNILRGAYLLAAPYIERLKTIFSPPENQVFSPSLQGEWLAVQSEFLTAQGKPEESRDLARQALKILPEMDPMVRSMVYVTLAKAFQHTYDYEHAAEVFQMIVRDARQKDDLTFEILGISGQAQMVLKQGHLHRTLEIVTEGIQRLETSGKKIPFGATLYGELGQVHFQWHHLDEAKRYLQKSLQASGKSGYSDPEIYHHIMLSKMFHMEGNLEAAAQEMKKAVDLATSIPPAMIRENIISQQVWIDLSRGRLAAAEELLRGEGFTFSRAVHFPGLLPDSEITYEAGLLYNSALRLLLYKARKKKDQAQMKQGIDISEIVVQGLLRCGHTPLALETLLLRSQMIAAFGDVQRSLAETAHALEIAEPEGFISVFIEEGKPIAETLAALLKSELPGKIRAECVQEILDSFPDKPSDMDKGEHIIQASHMEEKNISLVEPLTRRELEVLCLIADGDSNQEIADKLVVTVSAVKKHTGNIYSKLNVSSRTQAVRHARQLGLLPDK